MNKPIPNPLACRVCGNNSHPAFKVGDFRYATCEKCGSINKVLSQNEYESLNVTYDPGDFVDSLEFSELRRFLAVDTKKKALLPIVKRLEANHNDSSSLKLLDIGCGMGGYLLAGQELGLHVRGIEPSTSHSRVGRNVFGLDIVNSYFSSKSENEVYDLIILSHVIEHIFNQRVFLEEVYSILPPGGVIFLATPNAGSTVARLSGKYWSMLRPVDHVGLLTAEALAALAPQEALIQVRTEEYVWEPMIGLGTSLRNMLKARHNLSSSAPKENIHQTLETKSNSFRSSVDKVERNSALRVAATILSLPIYTLDRQLDMAACLIAEIQKPL